MKLFENEDFLITKSDTSYDKNVIFLNSAAGLDWLTTKGLIIHPRPHRQDKPIHNIYLQAGCNEINFLCKNASWYQRDSVKDCVNVLKKCVREAERNVIYGFSMGGFGAIHFAPDLGIPAIAFSPQATIDPAFPMHPTWKSIYKKAVHDHGYFNSNITSGRCKESNIYLFYDSRHHLDYKHAQYIIKNCHNCNSFNIPFGGHACSGTINKFYPLKKLVLEILNNEFNKDKFLSAFFSKYDPKANFIFKGWKFFNFLSPIINSYDFDEYLKRLGRRSYRNTLINVLHKVENTWPHKINDVINKILIRDFTINSNLPGLESKRVCNEVCALFYYNRKNYTAAAKLYENLYNIYPLSGSSLNNYIISLQKIGEKSFALNLLNNLLDIEPLNFNLLKLKAQFYLNEKMFKESRQILGLLKVINFTPEICIYLAQTFRFANNLKEAISILKRYQNIFSESGSLLSHLGCYLCMNGEIQEGFDILKLAKTKRDYPKWEDGWVITFKKSHPDYDYKLYE